MSNAPAPLGHNRGPLIPPTDVEMFEDLKARFPEVEKRLAEFEDSLKEFPTEFTLADADRAAALQDLLGQMKKEKTIIGAHKKTEKGPWDKLVKVVTNFFAKTEEKYEGLMEEWQPRHKAFMNLVEADNRRKAEEEADKQRKAEEENRRKAAEAEEAAAKAKAAEEEARAREEKARKDAEDAEQRRKEAEERARLAEAEEKRLDAEKKARDRAERELNETNLKAIRRHMKDAEALHTKAEAEEEVPADLQGHLDAFIRPGGLISSLAAPVVSSLLLSDEQKEEINSVRSRLNELRTANDERVGKRERTKRAKEAAAQEIKDKAAADERKRKREEEEAIAETARQARIKAEQEADAAKASGQAAKEEIREARAEAREAVQDQKGAAKVVRQATTDADRAANRADKIEDRLENATDAEIAGTMRGDLGTRGSLTRRWRLQITDEEALRAVCGPLGGTFTEDALNGAAYRFMMQRISGWGGRERVEGVLPGVVFMYDQGSRIA